MLPLQAVHEGLSAASCMKQMRHAKAGQDKGTHIKLLDEDEEVDFGDQAGHCGHARQESLWRRQVLQAATVCLKQLQLLLLWRDLHAHPNTLSPLHYPSQDSAQIYLKQEFLGFQPSEMRKDCANLRRHSQRPSERSTYVH